MQRSGSEKNLKFPGTTRLISGFVWVLFSFGFELIPFQISHDNSQQSHCQSFQLENTPESAFLGVWDCFLSICLQWQENNIAD